MKIPYGVSNFAELVVGGYYYLDRTQFIEEIEALSAPYLIYLRPRRFGKSLFVSMLQCYYGYEYQSSFNQLFGQYYIGKHPTKLANQYWVIRLNFSRIHTDTYGDSYQGFLAKVKEGIERFRMAYAEAFAKVDWGFIEGMSSPETLLGRFLNVVAGHPSKRKLYVLVDEYDHFANEIFAFDQRRFKETIMGNGFVRKFYEGLKEGTEFIIERIFITGVTPMTLDGLTSGFNIGSDISRTPRFHNMMGFKREEVMTMMHTLGVEEEQLERVMDDLRFWYNGYQFEGGAKEKLYNPDMLLYFANQYLTNGQYPERLLDTNIATDYGKLRSLVQMEGRTKVHQNLIEELIQEGSILGVLNQGLTFKKNFSEDDFISSLYYMGMLSMKNHLGIVKRFHVPNSVVDKLYRDCLKELLN